MHLPSSSCNVPFNTAGELLRGCQILKTIEYCIIIIQPFDTLDYLFVAMLCRNNFQAPVRYVVCRN